ncbi:MAG: IS5 family transposase [Nanoarchaeota archaeon]
MRIVRDKFKKVADFCYELFRISELKLYSHKFSKKMFSQYQHLFLLVYKQFRKFTYEELLTDIAGNSDIRVYLGLNKIPHYTTLIKFAKRLPMLVLDKLVIAFKEIIPHSEKVAIDATGMSLDNASLHYCKRIGLRTKKRPFMKTTFVVDIKDYFILLCKMRKKARHDTKDAKPMIKKLALHYKPEVFYADRGYDDNNIFKLCFEKLKAYPLILQRNLDVPKHKKSGTYRKMTCDVFDYGEYLQRNKIETLNSMFKRRFGSNVKSRTDKLQRVEIITRVIAYNIDRLIRTGKQVIRIFIRITRNSY